MVRSVLAAFGVLLTLAAFAYLLAVYRPSGGRTADHHFPRNLNASAVANAAERIATGGRSSTPVAHHVLVSFDWPLARLGNKMFQYAATLGVALHHHWPMTVMLDDGGKSRGFAQMKELFRIDSGSSTDGRLLRSAQQITEPGWGLYNAAVESAETFTNPVVTLMGYIQSWKYFGRHLDEIRRQYALTHRYEEAARSFLRRAKPSGASTAKPTVYVGLHVRRGDMLQYPKLYGAAPAGYIVKAVKFYLDKFEPNCTVVFIAATDDWGWLNDVFSSNSIANERIVATRDTAEMDFAVLSCCNHSIITGGSYGWWSAFLTGGAVVYYKDFISSSSELYQKYKEEDYYLPDWIGMT